MKENVSYLHNKEKNVRFIGTSMILTKKEVRYENGLMLVAEMFYINR